MSKRSNFPKIDKDKYHTPRKAVGPLLEQLPARTIFAEPCAGNGALIDHLTASGHQCVWASDISPERDDILAANALELKDIGADMFVTNPPWSRASMHPIIAHLSSMLPFWALFDADWIYTKQSAALIDRCAKIVPVGRIKWIPGSKHSGMDSCAWHLFMPGHILGPRFIGYHSRRAARTIHMRPVLSGFGLMGPEERRRAQIKAAGLLADPGPLFKIGGKDGEEKPRVVPLVSEGAGLLEQQREAGEIAPDMGPHHSKVSGRNGNGQELPSMQQDQGRNAAGGVGGVPASASDLLAKLRSGLRHMVLPRITPGDVEQ